MKDNLEYTAYLEKCEYNGIVPLDYSTWLHYTNLNLKTTEFRQGQKQEIGFDLDTDFTGSFGKAFTTSEGENLE